ncbi:sensor histidine kinase [Ruminiclostridium cellobioparum]|uniref:Histidine kinase n=1 Tax=Ruminiclostridium cellobioparum subsp. termitidis CT1112 TaxID=1195236 RepID=S0FTM9_RUMCE|nr:sensor histidine kinase [Ruminiclostridium cellobioparum]EMS73691.1 histidine kinase [Ruminiclostridium cellobioparum subsp. termitidis CT1112]
MKDTLRFFKYILTFLYKLLSNFLYDLEIRKKLYTINIIITLVPVIILGTKLYLISNQNLVETEKSFLSSSVRQMRDIVDFYMEGVVNRSDILFSDRNMQRILSVKYNEYGDLLEMYTNFSQKVLPLLNEYKYSNLKYSSYSLKNGVGLFLTFYSNNNSINSIFMNNNYDNIRILNFKQLDGEQWYRRAKDSKSSFFWRPTYTENKYVQNSDTPIKVISLNRQFYNFDTMENLGVISLAIPLDSIGDILHSITPREGCSAILMDQEGSLVCSSGQLADGSEAFRTALNNIIQKGEKGVGHLKVNGADAGVYYETSVISGWKMVLVDSGNTVETKTNEIVVTTLTISLLSFAGSLLIMLTLSKTITKRLKHLTTKIHRIKKDTTLPLQEIRGNDEIGELDQQFNEMLGRINHLIETEYKVKLYSQKIEYELLQEQINPHLLYNSLTAIRWISKKCGNLDAYEITENLIGFYKASLSKGNIFIKVSDEIYIITAYINLIRKIYKLDLDYRIDVDENICSYNCIKLILQPVVENSLLHGLRNSEKKGLITVKGQKAENLLIFEVNDNGDGMEQETIDKIMSDSGKDRKSFGLYNVMKRINLFCGDEYGLSITSRPGMGTSVKIKIPCCDSDGNITGL